ncbi:alpha/beta hydrolase [Fodinicurvata sp. EGI_FJ10296]|uniref:alpha/beta hydrolase n=1 Tax=Fodinicurvata sp. EGI_FJ10296 TaxID=3231908 RepID=UPI003451C311
MDADGASSADEAVAAKHWPGPTIDRVVTKDGLSIRRGRWQARSPSRGIALLMSGRTEFMEKYAETAADLTHRGYDVVGWDWRGQGLSDGRPPSNPSMGHVTDFSGYLADVATVVDSIDKSAIRIVLGHSMGGHMALRAVAAGLIAPPSMVLSAPMVGLRPVAGVPVRLIAAMARLMVAIGRGSTYPPGQSDGSAPKRQTFDGNCLTSDPLRFAVQSKWTDHNPGLTVGGPSWAWFLAAYRSCRLLSQPESIAKLTMPVTIVQAGQEELVDNAAQDRLVDKLGNARLVRIDEARHEILMERDALRDRFWEAFDATADMIANAS